MEAAVGLYGFCSDVVDQGLTDATAGSLPPGTFGGIDGRMRL